MGQRIILEGPLAGNEPFARCLSALTGVAVHVSADATGTATGAALLLLEADQDPRLGPAVAARRFAGFVELMLRIWRAHAQRAR